ncbi:MAG: Hpt domain-containing protein [Lachnospiraceae bacterium]|nr:Hpt domain-containing protein [Lachnospiraceae bacterium]
MSHSEKAVLDYADGLKRFSNMEMLYHKHLKKFLTDTTYQQLVDAMQQQDYETAFRQAHTLKGVTGNLSLVGFYDKLIPFVEALRDEADLVQAKAILPELEEAYQAAICEIEELGF